MASASPARSWIRSARDVGKNVSEVTVVVSTLTDDVEGLGLNPIDTATSTATSAANAGHLRMAVDTNHPWPCQDTPGGD